MPFWNLELVNDFNNLISGIPHAISKSGASEQL
jgi:hypothetical protein